MGNTFVDSWTPPQEIKHQKFVFKFIECDNTKYTGNYYYYDREDVNDAEIHRIILRSYSPRKLNIGARINLQKPGFEINLGTSDADVVPGVVADLKFTSVAECLQTAIEKYAAMLPVLQSFQPGVGWEGLQ